LVVVVLVILVLVFVFFLLLLVVVLVIELAVVVLDALGSFLLALETTLGQLLHHLKELLAVVLEQVVGDSEDACKVGSTERGVSQRFRQHQPQAERDTDP
jgi:hypothetical protein